VESAKPTFEEWLRIHFDPSVTALECYLYPDGEGGEMEPILSVDYITRTFEESGEVLRRFSDTQLNQGLWFLLIESGEMSALFAKGVSLSAQLGCIRSIFTLFKRCFAVRCSNSLSHREDKANPLNAVCYMWWDAFPAWGAPDDPARHLLDSELLRMIRMTLSLDSEAVRESALHGLNHWHLHYPDKTREIIDEFLNSRIKISRHLRTYALAARNGAVQ
jgi:hypothetical protein